MMPGLALAQANVLMGASRSQVVGALSRLSISDTGVWLPSSHAYATDVDGRIRSEKGVPSVNSAAFSEYVAASTFLHCGDGWGYLGRAIDALIKGDLGAAVHLCYYAELRSAISLLAGEGIYIGQFGAYALGPAGAVNLIVSTGTHSSAWQCLDGWNRTSRASTLLGGMLKPGSSSLDDWTRMLPGGVEPIISDLLQQVAFELQAFSEDKERRNVASYRPSRLSPEDLDPRRAREITSKLWQSLEPDSAGGFPLVDAALIHNILKRAYAAVNPEFDENGDEKAIDWSHWESWLASIVPSGVHGSAFHQDLVVSGTTARVDSPLAAAFDNDLKLVSPQKYIEHMLSRTMVMLRISTGACWGLAGDAGWSKSDLSAWVNSLALARGLWAPLDPPADAMDLWLDVEDSRTQLDSVTGPNLLDTLKGLGAFATALGQAERVVAWTFA